MREIHNEQENPKEFLTQLQFSLLSTSLEIVQALVQSPNSVKELLADYERLILNFYNTIHVFQRPT